MNTVYLVYYTVQDYDESDSVSSIWSTYAGANGALEAMDEKHKERYAAKGLEWMLAQIPSENGWAVEEWEVMSK